MDNIHQILSKIAKALLALSIISNKKKNLTNPKQIKDLEQIMLKFSEEEARILQEIFDSIREKSHLYIVDKAFECLRIHFALYALRKAKPLKTITFISKYLTSNKASFQRSAKPKGNAYPNNLLFAL